MFGYKFGDISKRVYNKTTQSNDDEKELEDKPKKGYVFGDVTKTAIKAWNNPNYKIGDISKSVYNESLNLTKSAYYSITGRYEPFKVVIKDAIYANWLQKKSPILSTYTKYWTVLQEHFLYFFKDKGKYEKCVGFVDLSKYIGGQRSKDNDGYFQIHSADETQIFYADDQQREQWMAHIMKVIIEINGVEQATEVKKSLALKKDASQPAAACDLQCIAYYIIDLEYSQSESGNVQQLIQNQNFIVASTIWSYIHEKDEKEYEKMMKDLDETQRLGAGYWLNWHSTSSYSKGGFKESRIAFLREAWKGAYKEYDTRLNGYHESNVPLPVFIALFPLQVSAGAIIGGASTIPHYEQKLTGSEENLNEESEELNEYKINKRPKDDLTDVEKENDVLDGIE